MTPHELLPDALMAFESASAQPLHEISVPMPPWLAAAPQALRDEYSARLLRYHTAADSLETYLEGALPPFDEFVREQLTARLKTDLGLHIDPNGVIVDLPRSVSRDYDINSQFGHIKNYAAPWVASAEREVLSLCELARRNFLADDEQMARRLDFAVIESDDPSVAAQITGPWLHTLIPQLDVAQGYRTTLSHVFNVRPDGSLQQQQHTQRMLQPYEEQIQLEAFCECACKRLSDKGYSMLTLAAQARSRAETDAAGLDLNWVQLKPGASLSGDHDTHTLSGVCLIRDIASNHSLLYLPQALQGYVMLEAPSPDQARSRLIDKLLNHPALIEYLAERTLDRHAIARHVSYINQSLMRGFEGFIGFVPALNLQPAQQLLQHRAAILQQRVESTARRRTRLLTERNWHSDQALFGYFRAMLGLLPGIGTLISIEDGWVSAHQTADAFESGLSDEGLLAMGAAALSVLDVVLSVVPGAASVALLTRMGRRAARMGAVSLTSGSSIPKAFDGYEATRSLSGALPQSGRNAGALLQDGQLWIERRGQAYAVYRRAGEETLRLKKTALRGYEPPVRLEHGEWAYHTDVGLRGGVRSAIAESLIAEAHPDPAFKARHARQLLDGFEFPADRQRRLELDIAVHYQKHRTTPGWAEAYRRPPEPANPSPQPGASGTKRKEPPTTEPAAQRPAQPGPSGSARAQGAPEAWQSWGRPIAEPDSLQQVVIRPPIFRAMDGQGSDFVHLDGQRYDILPSGSAQHPTIVFLKNPDMADDSFAGLNEVIRSSHHQQPIMASFEEGRWAIKGPLFKLKIQLLVEQARPGMTAASYRILAERIYNAADTGHTGLTASRLINMRATLNAWQKGQLAPLMSLHDPLSMLEPAQVSGITGNFARLRLSYGPSLDTFQRLDFIARDEVLAPLLRTALNEPHFNAAGRQAVRELMKGVLTRAGYNMVSAGESTLQQRSIMLFRRPGQEPLYLLNVRRVTESRVELRVSEPGMAVPMSNRWIDQWLASNPEDHALRAVVDARTQGTLIKLVGGLRLGSASEFGTQIFVQRIASDF